MSKVNEVLNNKSTMRDIRSSVVLIIVLLSPIAILMISNNFKIESLFNFEIAVLGIWAIFMGIMLSFEIKTRAVDDEVEDNEDLKKVLGEKIEEQKKVTDIDCAIEFLKTHNEKENKLANKIFTDKKISNLQNKVYKLKMRGTDEVQINGLEERIKLLRINPLIDKKFKHVKVADLLLNESVGNKDITIGRSAYVYNPKQESWIIKILVTPLKFLGFGGALLGSFALGMDFESIFIFYAVFITMNVVFGLWKYLNTRKRTSGIYLATQRNSLALLKELNSMPNKEVDPISIPKESINDISRFSSMDNCRKIKEVFDNENKD